MAYTCMFIEAGLQRNISKLRIWRRPIV